MKVVCEGMRSQQPGAENRLSDTLRLTCSERNKRRPPPLLPPPGQKQVNRPEEQGTEKPRRLSVASKRNLEPIGVHGRGDGGVGQRQRAATTDVIAENKSRCTRGFCPLPRGTIRVLL